VPVIATACPRNCYSTCAMNVVVEDGRLIAVEPDPRNPATAEGPCLKGLSYVERQHHPDRILSPLRRQSDGAFAPVSWDTALDEIAGRLGDIRERFGPRAVLFYSSSGTKGLLNGCGEAFWRRFGGCTTTYGDLCWPAGLEASRLTLGDNIHNDPEDLAAAKLIVMWGKNTAETNIHQMNFVDRALDAGAKLVVVDPRRTQTSERAELLIQPRPGTDGVLALAVARLLIDHGGVNNEFVRDHVLGFDAFGAMVHERDVDEAARVCDVPRGAIERLAELWAVTRPATLCAGFGMQRYTNSGQTMRALLALPVITGNIGVSGGGWVYANLATQIFGARSPFDFLPPEKDDGVVRVGVSTARLGRDLPAVSDPPVRMAWVERGNPLSQQPETSKVREAFAGLEFTVVVEQFMTDTAHAADLILPAKTMFEQTDVIGAYWHPYLQLRRKALEPSGEARPETEIYRALAERLDFAGPELDAEIPGPDDAAVRRWLEEKLAPHGIALADFDDGPVRPPGHPVVAFADRVFPTPSGRIELLSEEAARRWNVDPLPRVDLPDVCAARPGSDPAYPLQMMTPNTKNRIHSQFGNLDLIASRDPGPQVQMHPDDAAARGIAPDDPVRVFNARGEVTVAAVVDAGIRRGCVSVTNGWWASQGCAANLTSEGVETDMAHGAAFHDNLVQAERAGGER